MIKIHRLVAEAFIENKQNKKCVNHKNGNKKCNYEINLEWNTYSENNFHAYNTGLHASGEKNVKSIFSENFIKKICEFLEYGYKPKKIKKFLGYDTNNKQISKLISVIKHKKQWK